MNLETLTNGLLKLTGKSGLTIKANSPEILLGVGILGILTASVLACKATLRCQEILIEHVELKEQIQKTRERAIEGKLTVEYSEKDKQKDLAILYTNTGLSFVKLYGPAILLGISSIACILGGHKIMKARNLALVAAYKAVHEGFIAYRKRVIEEHGENIDYMYKNGLKAVDIVTPEYIDENGKKHKPEKKTVMEMKDPNGLSVYARFFDESCSQWSKTPEYNLMFLKAQQNYFNDMLKARGHVFLNEVYDALGIPRSGAGAIVGWVIGKGDDFIDFGLFDGDRPKVREFINGNERSIILDFNVDGVIYDSFTNIKV
jgi:hypothetical protein